MLPKEVQVGILRGKTKSRALIKDECAFKVSLNTSVLITEKKHPSLCPFRNENKRR